MTEYERGAYLERRVRAHLQHDGYLVVRSAGSKSPLDLLAVKVGETLLIQVKRGGRLPVADWNELVDLADYYAGHAILATSDEKRGRLRFWRLTGRRKPYGKTYPCEPFSTDRVRSRETRLARR